jgi:hypothetical protein
MGTRNLSAFQNQVFLESPKLSKRSMKNQPVVRGRCRMFLEIAAGQPNALEGAENPCRAERLSRRFYKQDFCKLNCPGITWFPHAKGQFPDSTSSACNSGEPLKPTFGVGRIIHVF